MVESAWTIFEIAAGTGMLGHGVGIALDALGIRADVVGGCEWDASAAAAFLAGVENETGRRPAVWNDARTFAPRRWRSRTRSVVDIVTAGYPCQGFSYGGRRAGSKDARHLWPACRRIVARLEPSIVFFENVDGHVTLGLWKVLRDCERLGYRTTAGVYSSEEVGAPHIRKRVFVLGAAHAARQRVREAGGELAYGIGERLENWGAAGAGAEEREAADRRDGELARPLFPPGRTDYRRWAELAADGLDQTLMPAIESGVPMVADGMARAADLLRLGGNGVNPLCAAWAFLSLTACLMDPVADPSAFGPLFAGAGDDERLTLCDC